ncbi:MAG: hypothetical protein ABJA78_15390 [Ferruginibacter sp.]
MKYRLLLFVLLTVVNPLLSDGQAILDADGPGNTYELINSIFAPGYDAVENPECVHPAFGRHIAEVWDSELGQYAFEFYIHVNPDNDRCINFDRQRVEIKTYESSPDSLKGVVGESLTYTWKFRLAAGFQPSTSFTHIHQVKAVNGDDADPIFTLTCRKATPNKLELIHDNTTKVAIVNLSLFTGTWVEATENITVGANGTYSLLIKRVSDNAILLNYSNSNIMTIRPDNDFIRPKWGIYRSLTTPSDLRDDTIRFAHLTIKEHLTYSFTGSGNWNNVSNWMNNRVPPASITAGDTILINGAGSCILNIPYKLTAGAKLSVVAGKNFIIQGNLTQQ